MVDNFSSLLITLIPNQHVAKVDDHLNSLIESNISHGQMLRILDTSTTKYCEREYEAKDINLINKHLADECEAACGQEDEKPITADIVELGIDSSLQHKVLSMLRKHEAIWSENLGEITATTNKNRSHLRCPTIQIRTIPRRDEISRN